MFLCLLFLIWSRIYHIHIYVETYVDTKLADAFVLLARRCHGILLSGEVATNALK